MNFDRTNIKVETISTIYYYNGNNVTAEIIVAAKMPEALAALVGVVYKTIKATAKCHAEDNYDKKIGEKMALARAEAKAYRQVANTINTAYYELNDALISLKPIIEEFNAKAEKSVAHNDRYVKELPNKK